MLILVLAHEVPSSCKAKEISNCRGNVKKSSLRKEKLTSQNMVINTVGYFADMTTLINSEFERTPCAGERSDHTDKALGAAVAF